MLDAVGVRMALHECLRRLVFVCFHYRVRSGFSCCVARLIFKRNAVFFVSSSYTLAVARGVLILLRFRVSVGVSLWIILNNSIVCELDFSFSPVI